MAGVAQVDNRKRESSCDGVKEEEEEEAKVKNEELGEGKQEEEENDKEKEGRKNVIGKKAIMMTRRDERVKKERNEERGTVDEKGKKCYGVKEREKRGKERG